MDVQAQKVIAALRTARAALSWSQDDLAQQSGTALVTIARMEAGRASPRLSTIAHLKQALEDAGVRIIDESPAGGFTVVVESRALRLPDLADDVQRTRIGQTTAAKKRNCPSSQPLTPQRQSIKGGQSATARPQGNRKKIG